MRNACLFLLSCFSCGAFSLAWNAPDDYLPDAYIVMHGTQSGTYFEWLNAGPTNYFEWPSAMPTGVNYFTVTALAYDDVQGLQMTAPSNETSVTNTPQVILTSIILTSTNAGPPWKPWSTNQIQFSTIENQQFFMLAPLVITSTNKTTF